MILCIARRCEKGSKAIGLGTFFLPLSNFADQHNDPVDRGRDKKVQRCGRTALGVDRPPRLPIGGALHAPIGTILAAAMMLRYSFDMAAEADAIERAVDKTLRSGFRCGDIMQENCQLVGCKAMGAEIRSRI